MLIVFELNSPWHTPPPYPGRGDQGHWPDRSPRVSGRIHQHPPPPPGGGGGGESPTLKGSETYPKPLMDSVLPQSTEFEHCFPCNRLSANPTCPSDTLGGYRGVPRTALRRNGPFRGGLSNRYQGESVGRGGSDSSGTQRDVVYRT